MNFYLQTIDVKFSAGQKLQPQALTDRTGQTVSGDFAFRVTVPAPDFQGKDLRLYGGAFGNGAFA